MSMPGYGRAILPYLAIQVTAKTLTAYCNSLLLDRLSLIGCVIPQHLSSNDTVGQELADPDSDLVFSQRQVGFGRAAHMELLPRHLHLSVKPEARICSDMITKIYASRLQGIDPRTSLPETVQRHPACLLFVFNSTTDKRKIPHTCLYQPHGGYRSPWPP